MTPERYKRIRELFAAVCERPADERSALLDEACGDDPELREAVEVLLAFDEQPVDIMKSAVITPGPKADESEVNTYILSTSASSVANAPEQVGPYRIIRRIGEGGMGTVFEAEQDKPRRTVALKIIRRGLASQSLLRRFDHEAHVLGRLQHPGIAQIYEAGIAEPGRPGAAAQPFFAMELVRGRTLLEYVNKNGLGTRQRLKLLAKICDAVEHAHQKGVIHRDLKPGNILVDESGQPKVLDFGVARATDADIQLTTIRTDVGQLIGTIPYMSPEQVSADPLAVDTRSDVYALGVVTYEVLSGKLPYDLVRKTIPEAALVIRETEPARLSSINPMFRGDVETIVAKALAKDRDRRYGSAAELAADIRRYLRDEPIVARPPTTMYQLGKFAKRNKGLVAGVMVAFVVLIMGIVVSTGFAIGEARAYNRAESERQIAERQARIAESVNLFLNNDLLAAVSPEEQGMDVSMREVLEVASKKIEGAFEGEPVVEAAIRMTLAKTYLQLGDYDAVEPHLLAALELRRAALGEEDIETGKVHTALGVLYKRGNRWKEAEDAYLKSLRICLVNPEKYGEDVAKIRSNLGGLYLFQGRYDEAEPLISDALEWFRANLGEEQVTTLFAMNHLAGLYLYQGRLKEAEPLFRKILEVQRREIGEEHPSTQITMSNLSTLYEKLGRYDEAERLLVSAVETLSRVNGPEHPNTLIGRHKLGRLQVRSGQHEEAERLLVSTLEASRGALGNEHRTTAKLARELGKLYDDLGRLDEAEKLLIEASDMYRRAMGDDHPETPVVMEELARFHDAQKRFEQAESLRLEAYKLCASARGPNSKDTIATCRILIDFYGAWDKPDKADEWRAKLPEGASNPPSDEQ